MSLSSTAKTGGFETSPHVVSTQEQTILQVSLTPLVQKLWGNMQSLSHREHKRTLLALLTVVVLYAEMRENYFGLKLPKLN